MARPPREQARSKSKKTAKLPLVESNDRYTMQHLGCHMAINVDVDLSHPGRYFGHSGEQAPAQCCSAKVKAFHHIIPAWQFRTWRHTSMDEALCGDES